MVFDAKSNAALLLQKRLESELNDIDSVIKDIDLVGSDGGRVGATKAILAIQSPVFRRMFFGDFREAGVDCDDVKIDYPIVALRAIVTHCYTGELLLEQSREEASDKEIIAMLQVRDAANYFELPELRRDVSSALNRKVDLQCDCICTIMQYMLDRGETEGYLWSACIHGMKKDPMRCLQMSDSTDCENCGIRGISFSLLKEILKHLSAYITVLILQKWIRMHDSIPKEELVYLQSLSDDINLESMEPPKLANIVPCTLFTKDRLYEAIVTALRKGPFPQRKGPFPLRKGSFPLDIFDPSNSSYLG